MASVNSTLCEEDEAVGLNLAKLRVFVAVVEHHVAGALQHMLGLRGEAVERIVVAAPWPRPGRAPAAARGGHAAVRTRRRAARTISGCSSWGL